MGYVRVGNSGLKVSKIVLGCMTYGNPSWQPWVLPLEESLPIMKHAYDRALTPSMLRTPTRTVDPKKFVDVFLKIYNIKCSSIVIMFKIFYSSTYIDVLEIHRLDRESPMEEIMKALNDIVETWEFRMVQTITGKHGWHKFISMQGFYNLLYRDEERELNPYCKPTGVGLFPLSPLAAAWHRLLWGGSLREGEMTPICGLNSKERIDQAVKGVKVLLTEEECACLEEPYLPKTISGC
ncbi:NADP-dependent oxidoreductase domain-containing protein [Bisporella sp. PMI_857]|nr:NADP-dependent oxidoreductase domain-containing protein [Bisporella sp. PMI_857]